ncbi:MAG: Gldg family protein [Deltaproteobacteria bacterium]|nr:Gldg family protein [Deltaproteobacteria bacterium]MBW2338758.1 Gldg family protein [Deltaproteobacteria bacterium]
MKGRSGKYVRFLAYLVVTVLVNVAGITLFFRLDLTANRIYSISGASKEVVSTLSEPLTINVFFTKNLPAPYNNTERYLRDLLEEYAIYANQYFNYRFYDVSPEQGGMSRETRQNQELARSYGIYPVQIRVIQKDEVKFQKAYMGLVMIHGDLLERITTITSTEGLEYKLTTTIEKLNNKISALLGLPEKIRVKLFLSSSLEGVAPYLDVGDLAKLPGRLEGIVEKLNDKNYGKLEFIYLDPTKDEALEGELQKYHILSLKWPALSGGKIQPGKGSIGMVMEYGDRVVDVPLIRVLRVPLIGTRYELTDLSKMEDIINENVESIIDINQDIGYLADHGTLELTGSSMANRNERRRQETLSTFRSLISQTYTIKSVNLKDGFIPEGINCLIIGGPTETFTDYDLFQIDQFLMRGKNLAVFLDRFKEIMPSNQQGKSFGAPLYVPIETGLEKLLEHYGISIKKSYVMDENCYRQTLQAGLGGGERPIYFVPIIKNRFISQDLDFMKNIKGLITMKVSPLELDTERIGKNGLKAYKLFASSERSWEMSGRINLNPMLIRPPHSSEGERSLPLAYVLEGEFPSYFAGKPIPEKKLTEGGSGKPGNKGAQEGEVDLSKIKGKGRVISKGKSAKILLVGSSEMLKDNLLDVKGRSPNSTFIMNVLDFLNNREGIAAIRSKEQRFNPLYDAKAGTKTFVKFFNIAGLPILVILFGFFVWVRRHARKRHIQMMFEK